MLRSGGRREQTARPGSRPSPVRRRLPGDLTTGDFLHGLLDATRAALPPELQGLEARQQGSLVKLFADDPAIHFELWLHRSRARIELGLHFETRDARRNQRLLAYVADELVFLKQALGEGIEAEPWDKGWARVYLTQPLTRLGPAEQARLARAFATLIETLEPIRREAIEATAAHNP
jgi:hypothetical protein